jgi:outer membrane protein assembly factor BamB
VPTPANIPIHRPPRRPSPATRERLYINFLNRGARHITTALSINGKVLWQQKVCDFGHTSGLCLPQRSLHESFGPRFPATTAAVERIAALDRDTGRIVWSRTPAKIPKYTTPAILQVDGRNPDGGRRVQSHHQPRSIDRERNSGRSTGPPKECVVTAVTDGVCGCLVSGGWPRNHTVAVRADGSGPIAWQNNARVYVPSMVVKAGHLYAVMDAGFAGCLEGRHR